MQAIILGCSHAAGAEMYQDTSITITNPDTFGYANSYPAQIAQQLGYTPRNYSISGGSNDAMFRIFVEQLPTLTSEDLVIACWTGPDRTEVYNDIDHEWLPFGQGRGRFYPTAPSDVALSGFNCGGEISNADIYINYLKQWCLHTNAQANQLNKVKNIIALNTMANSRGIRVINIDNFAPVDVDIKWVVPVTFCTWAIDCGYPPTSMGHFFLDAHTAFAEYVVSAIKTT